MAARMVDLGVDLRYGPSGAEAHDLALCMANASEFYPYNLSV